MPTLFDPFAVKSLQVKNRFVMSPMTRSFSPDGIPGDDVAAYYARRAAHDVGLIITEGAAIDRPASVEGPRIPRLFGKAPLDAWRKVVDGVHAEGGLIAPQLWHVGASYNPPTWDDVPEFEGPSGLKCANEVTGRVMTEADIAATIDAFARAAADSVAAGFDCIALHGAHGYLIDQFFWSETNLRQDGWGGQAIGARARFGAEVVRAVRDAIGPDIAIILRISQWKIQAYHEQMAQSPQALEQWLAPLVDAGVDIFDCSQRRFWEPEFADSDLNFAGWVKKLTAVPTITVGSVGLSTDLMTGFAGEEVKAGSLDELHRRFDRGDFDLVAVGRALLSDYEWVSKVREGRLNELADFDPAKLGVLA